MEQQLLEKMVELRPRVKEKTLKNYLQSVRKIGRIMTGEKDPDWEWIIDSDGVVETIHENYSERSWKTLLGNILTITEAYNAICNYEWCEVYDEYGDHLLNTETPPKQEKSDKQTENWIEYDDLIEFYIKMTEFVEQMDLMDKEVLDYEEYDYFQKWVIASCYLAGGEDNPPVRCDYADMRIVRKIPAKPTENMLLVKDKGMDFVFVNYKTSKTYGTEIIPVGEELEPILKNWIAKKRRIQDYLFVDSFGKVLTKNVMAKWLPEIFAGTGKRIGANMIRHIFTSHHFPADKKRRAKIAKKMLHSPAMNVDYSLE